MIAILACLSAALAISAGAFGAHGVTDIKAAEWLRTGGLYQLIHAVAAITIMGVARGAAATMLIGAAIFALSLYVMALGGPRWLGAVTPVGGALMIAAWLWAAWQFHQR